MAKAAIFVGAFDQAGNVGHRDASVFGKINDTYERVQRGEWISSRLWLGGGEFAKERGFSSIRIPHQSDIGDRPQLK